MTLADAVASGPQRDWLRGRGRREAQAILTQLEQFGGDFCDFA
jgi:hypothetical protein